MFSEYGSIALLSFEKKAHFNKSIINCTAIALIRNPTKKNKDEYKKTERSVDPTRW